MVLAATKERIESAAFRSGNDDESENDFIKACEDAYSLHSDWKALEGDKKVSAVDLKDKDKKAAEMIRRASMGDLTREELLNLNKKDSRSTPSSNDGRSTPASSYGNLSSITQIMEGWADALRDHQTTMRVRLEAKLEAKRQKSEARQEWKKQKLILEKVKFEEKQTQAAHARSIKSRRMELEEKKLELELLKLQRET